MKGERKYLVFLIGAALIYLGMKVFGPQDHNWTTTYDPEDKNPYGGYVLNSLLPDLFKKDTLFTSYNTFYEELDSIVNPINALAICSSFSPDEEDTELLLDNISKGGHAFIAANYYYGQFADTLSLDMSNYYYTSFNTNNENSDTSTLVFKNPDLASTHVYEYPKANVYQYFSEFDTTRTTVLAVNEMEYPVLLNIKFGKGSIILSSTPMAFSNAFILHGENHEYVARSLSMLPDLDIYWSIYYQRGRMEVDSPLRFILVTEPLTWAYYLVIGSILLFIFFEAKRRQRIIPVIKPLTNTSLEFVNTIGNLYFQHGDHKDLVSKKIQIFLEQIRHQYRVNTSLLREDTINIIASRSGNQVDAVQELFALIDKLQKQIRVEANDLTRLNSMIEKFYNKNLTTSNR